MNNEAKWLAMMYGVELLTSLNIGKAIIIGYSHHIIQKIMARYMNGNIRCKRMVRRITHSIEGKDYSFVHILWENNEKEDSLSNQGSKLELGSGFLHSARTNFHPIP